ncbi:hypothetical protein SSX86_011448 [Deinandra increscens subsp. villosa]|uniref:C3H1-type domain-containing protein n=1 Tax=Deinandra increscens subsp. villosa TaxID=3103831 RepID=A0AAP0D704_9ASTR
MDYLYGISNSKAPKHSSLTPVRNFPLLNPYCHQLGHVVDQYLSHDVHNTALKNLNSPNHRHFQSGRSLLASPSSALENQPSGGHMYHHHSTGNHGFGSRMESPRQSRSPMHFSNIVKVEEDVVVFDGVHVNDLPADRSRSSSFSLTDSGGSSSSSGKSRKREPCLSYLENSGFCRYGTRCQVFPYQLTCLSAILVNIICHCSSLSQFAHGNQEQHLVPFSFKSMLEIPCKSYSLSGSCSFGSNCRFLHNEASTPTFSTPRTVSQIKPDGPISSIVKLKSSNWSPMDDDITTHLNQDFDSYINKVLYGPRRIKRPPVFTWICQE